MLPRLNYRMKVNIPRVPPEIVALYGGYSTGNVVDVMGKLGGAMDYRIKPLHPDWWLCGTAVTVKCRPVDNAVIYKAIELCRPGDVLVISDFCSDTHSMWGGIMGLVAKKQGVAGVVSDGLVRDISGIIETGMPVFARGATPNSAFKDGPGEINYPVSCGGVVVEPGDIVLGDRDGVVVVPGAYAAEVAGGLPGIIERERRTVAAIMEHEGFFVPEWVKKGLDALELDVER